jgi:MGT family glycosyltransferase
MRILFSCWPFEGHLFPQMSIALAAIEQGHEVAFYTDARWSDTITDQGATAFPFQRVGPAWEAVRDLQAEQGGRRQSLRVTRQTFRDWLAETVPGQVEDLREITAGWHPDVIVTDHTMWGPSLVLREADGIPVAIGGPWICALIPGPDAPPPGLMLSPASTPRARRRQNAVAGVTALLASGLRRRLDEIRAGYGLRPMGATVNEFLGGVDLFLVFSTPEFDLNRWDLPPSVRYVGPCQWYPPRADQARADQVGGGDPLAGIPTGRPWVHVTDGTSNFQDPFLLRAAVEAMSGSEVELIVSKGRDRDRAAFAPDPLAGNIHVRDWLGYDELLPRCAAMVTVAGSGSTTAGLLAGLPLVVVPTSWDQPDNALRVQESGAGVVIRPRRCSAKRVRAALDGVLGDPSYREAARRCGEQLRAAPGPPGAVELIGGLVASRQPPGHPASPSVGAPV